MAFPLRLAFTTMRPHQWVKNVLVFVAPIMAHRILEPEVWLRCGAAFAAFSLAASSAYVINDVLDREADRAHRTKRLRPIAAGELSEQAAWALAMVLLSASVMIGIFLTPQFLGCLGGYVATTLLYSLAVKRIMAADIVVLSLLYSLRIVAGGIATMIAVSHWLLAFSLFFFFSLACVKRFSELKMVREESSSDRVRGRGYEPGDLECIAQFGAASGLLSVLVLALYVTSREVMKLYSSPEIIWLVCPLLLYWMSRVWVLAHRGDIHDDPIVFALTDRVSYGVGLAAAIVLWGAS